jgi:hypothetical protein
VGAIVRALLAFHENQAVGLVHVTDLEARHLQWLEELERKVVLQAPAEGLSWSRIGSLLGRTKQALWKRYRDPDER